MCSPVRALPGPRRLLPSYLRATSSRYQRRMVSGVTMLATSPSAFLPIALPLHREATTLGVGQAQPPSTELLPQGTILLDEILHHCDLLAGQPPSHGEDQELERRAGHGVAVYRRAVPKRWRHQPGQFGDAPNHLNGHGSHSSEFRHSTGLTATPPAELTSAAPPAQRTCAATHGGGRALVIPS